MYSSVSFIRVAITVFVVVGIANITTIVSCVSLCFGSQGNHPAHVYSGQLPLSGLDFVGVYTSEVVKSARKGCVVAEENQSVRGVRSSACNVRVGEKVDEETKSGATRLENNKESPSTAATRNFDEKKQEEEQTRRAGRSGNEATVIIGRRRRLGRRQRGMG